MWPWFLIMWWVCRVRSKRLPTPCERSLRWAVRCRDAATRTKIRHFLESSKGGLDAELREASAKGLTAMDFPGYAIGGLSVGESSPRDGCRPRCHRAPFAQADRPRYLMGVGRPEDLLKAICRGVDLFDCVLPTRSGRHGVAFTDRGVVRLKNECHRGSAEPLEEDCPCPACQRSRGYLRHLLIAGEMLGPILLSLHNVTYYQRLLRRTREAILADSFGCLLPKAVCSVGVWRDRH